MNERLTLRVERDESALGPEWDVLFAGVSGLESTRAWLAAVVAAAIPAGATPSLLALSDAAGPLALMPMLAGPGRRWGSLTTPYTCRYQPLLRPGAADGAALQEIGRYCRQWPLMRLEALDPAWTGLGQLRRGFAKAGIATRLFAHFGNWHEAIAGGSWEAYLGGRPGALRETIRRRTRAATRAGLRIEIARDEPGLTAALAAYEDVYRRSWKEPEPYPAFNAALVRALAKAGILRIGVMWSGDRPVAAQYWAVVNRVATVLKLAHDEEFKSASPGTVLTAATIRELIEDDEVTELDFGRGDDPYKRGWVGSRRPRVGLLGVNVRTVTGLRALAVHDAGTVLRAVRSAYAMSRRRLETKRAETSR